MRANKKGRTCGLGVTYLYKHQKSSRLIEHINFFDGKLQIHSDYSEFWKNILIKNMTTLVEFLVAAATRKVVFLTPATTQKSLTESPRSWFWWARRIASKPSAKRTSPQLQHMWRRQQNDTLQGTNISHFGTRKIIIKMPFLGDMLVPWRVSVWKISGKQTWSCVETLHCVLILHFSFISFFWEVVHLHKTSHKTSVSALFFRAWFSSTL